MVTTPHLPISKGHPSTGGFDVRVRVPHVAGLLNFLSWIGWVVVDSIACCTKLLTLFFLLRIVVLLHYDHSVESSNVVCDFLKKNAFHVESGVHLPVLPLSNALFKHESTMMTTVQHDEPLLPTMHFCKKPPTKLHSIYLQPK